MSKVLSSQNDSPLNPWATKESAGLVETVILDPVLTPVTCSKSFLKNVFPDLINDPKQILGVEEDSSRYMAPYSEYKLSNLEISSDSKTLDVNIFYRDS